MKIIIEEEGMERDEALRGMVVNIGDKINTWGGDTSGKLFVSDRWLREVFNMAVFKGFWEKK